MQMQEFDLLAHTLEPATTLIEASAGTGKTYNIQHLYLRFIVEEGMTPDKILVVTFSNEATAELKLRITENLAHAEGMLLDYFSTHPVIDDPSGFDQSLFQILKRVLESTDTSYEEVLRRVQFAYKAMDEAAVLTIHKFCLSVLTDFAFESGALFGLELVENKNELLADLVSDFLKTEIVYRDDFLGVLYREFVNKDFFSGIAKAVYGKDDVAVLGDALDLPDVAGLYSVLQLEDLVSIKEKLVLKKRKKLFLLFELLTSVKSPNSDELLEFIRIINSSDMKSVLTSAYFVNELPVSIQDVIITIREIRDRIGFTIYRKFVKYLEERYCSTEITTDKASVGFDDILYMTRAALKREYSNLNNAVCWAYSAVLVDEFQDTSGVQFDIFNTLFGAGKVPFFMIGDPKQSIYAFRGADIFSYLKAVESDGIIRATLSKNFRSTPEYIDAMNALFMNRDSDDERLGLPFIFKKIQYIDIEAGRKDQCRLSIEGDISALEFRWVNPEKELATTSAEDFAIKSVADDIACKLNLSLAGRAYYSDNDIKKELVPSDFAVLVEKNHQGEAIRKELNKRGIVAVVLKSGNVFTSREADEIAIILRAILNSRNEGAVMAALSTRCFNYTPVEIESLRENNIAVNEYWFDFFAKLNSILNEYGFLQAFSLFFEQDHSEVEHTSSKAVLATSENGERAITNYLQLVEILENELLTKGCADDNVLGVLDAKRSEASKNDEYEMRLESDEEAVKIMTVHKSKGLQFSVVYVPFLYSAVGNYSSLKYPITCNVEGEKSIGLIISNLELKHRKEQIKLEERAEKVRLLYVALTRAVDKCIVYGGAIKGIADSALADVLGSDFSRLSTLQENNNIAVIDGWSNTGACYNPVVDSVELECREFGATIERDWGVMSYSSLVSHDFVSIDVRSDATISGHDNAEEVLDILDNLSPLPSSNKVGSAVHEVIEEVDFSTVDTTFAPEEVLARLRKYGVVDSSATVESVDSEVVAVKNMLSVLSNLPLVDCVGTSFTLADVPLENHRAEMSFYFPVRDRISTTRLADFFKKRGLARYRTDGELKRVLAGLGLSLQSKGFREGFLFGLVDLVFEYEGKFYFADWKTNNLARYGGYNPAAVLTSMGESGYLLQFYIYTVALNLFLRSRIKDFDYNKHFGGGYYLYLRGLEVANPSHGVFYEAPSEEDVNELISIFTGGDNEF